MSSTIPPPNPATPPLPEEVEAALAHLVSTASRFNFVSTEARAKECEQKIRTHLAALTAERDALAERVRELELAKRHKLSRCADFKPTYRAGVQERGPITRTMTPVYLIYRLDCGGYVLVDEDGSSAHYETLGELFAEIARCEEPHGAVSMVAIEDVLARLREQEEHD